ncbi:MAG: GNAT family N-acetyltransferase [Clostridiaceae bacterium]|nr:GNAT family N-acetyltransferase [Clostridiaceae bacterium]
MEFRNATLADIDRILEIIKQAKEYLRNAGVNQWQNDYPDRNILESDIDRKIGYVLINDAAIVATVAVSFNDEKTYEKIYEGNWITDDEYAVIHRIAVDNNFKGQRLSSIIISKVEEICLNRNIHSIKVDTHRKNVSMRKMLSNNDFKYCGIIYLEDGSERVAYEKII